MKVLFFNSIGKATWGGGEKWMLLAARGLRDKGHEVYFGGRENSVFLENCQTAGFQTLGLRIKGDFGPSAIWQISRFMRNYHINAVVPNFNKDIRLCGMAGFISTRPVVLARSGLAILQDNWRYRLSYKWFVDGIITNTLAIKKQYLSYNWLTSDFIRVIHNGLDTNGKVYHEKANLAGEFDLPDHQPVVGFFGRLSGQKQPLFFLEVAQKIQQKFPDAIFPMVGEGPMRDEILAYAAKLGLAENVYLLGFQKDVFKLYAICDLVLLTSEREGLPNVVMESMLAGKTVVAFDVDGVSELILSEETGIRISPNDIYQMSEQAINLLNEPERIAAIGQAARKFIRANFSVEIMVDKVEQYLKDLLAQRGKSIN